MRDKIAALVATTAFVRTAPRSSTSEVDDHPLSRDSGAVSTLR
ncbi:hypothetical protein AB0L41_03850 [Amycolatopsis mediterranei]